MHQFSGVFSAKLVKLEAFLSSCLSVPGFHGVITTKAPKLKFSSEILIACKCFVEVRMYVPCHIYVTTAVSKHERVS